MINVDVEHLGRLQDHYAKHRTLPSYAGIGKVVGYRAKTSAVKLANRLIAAGYLRAAPGGKLVPTERFFELPLATSSVRAGAADVVEGQITADLMTLDSFLVREPSKTVLVRVKGDSMCDAGILEGDLCVVERAQVAGSGQIVVAVIDGSFTVKELAYEGEQPMLVPHNANYERIYPKQHLEIFGIVRGLVRQYSSRSTFHPRAFTGVNS